MQKILEETEKLKEYSKMAANQMFQEIGHLSGIIKMWQQEINKLIKELPDVEKVIEEIPGLGNRLASTVVVELGHPREYKNAKAYCKAAGCVPKDRSTGGKQIYGRVSGQGNPRARWAFVEAVISCFRASNEDCKLVKDWLLKLAKKRGSKKLAVIAAARKLASAVFYLFRYGDDFDLKKIFWVKPESSKNKYSMEKVVSMRK